MPAPHRSQPSADRPVRDGLDPSGAALLRLPVRGPLWAESLPPVPGGRRVTVSFSPPSLASGHGDTVELLGYELVEGVDQDGGPVAWIVVDSALALAHGRWWASVRDLADAAFPLAMGPVLRRYGAVLDPHLFR